MSIWESDFFLIVLIAQLYLYSDHRQVKYERQTVTLSGLGADAFGRAVSSIHDVHSRFARTLPEGQLEEWGPTLFDSEFSAIEVGNRYFTGARDVGVWSKVPFGLSVDPYGVLLAAGGTSYVHCEDNVVQYYKRVVVPGDSGVSKTM